MFLPLVSRRMRAEDYPFRRPLIPFVARCSRAKAFVNEYYPEPFEVKLRSSNVIVLSAICITGSEPEFKEGTRHRWAVGWKENRIFCVKHVEGRRFTGCLESMSLGCVSTERGLQDVRRGSRRGGTMMQYCKVHINSCPFLFFFSNKILYGVVSNYCRVSNISDIFEDVKRLC